MNASTLRFPASARRFSISAAVLLFSVFAHAQQVIQKPDVDPSYNNMMINTDVSSRIFGVNAWYDIKGSSLRVSFSYSPALVNLIGNNYLPATASAAAGSSLAGPSADTTLSSNYIRRGEPEKALPEIEKAEQAAKANQDPKLQASLLDLKGAAYMEGGEFEKAMDAYRAAMVLERSLNDLNGQGEMFLRTAWVYQSMHNSAKALECYQAAQGFFESSKNKEGIVRAKLGLRSAYQSAGDVKVVRSEMNWVAMGATPEQAARALAGDGQVLLAKDDAPDARYRYTQALPFSESLSDAALQARVWAGLGLANSAVGFSSDATKQLETARSRVPAYNRDAQAAVLASMGDVKVALALDADGGNQRSAIKGALNSYNEALPLMRATLNHPGEMNVLSGMGAAYELSKDWSQAHNSYLEAVSILESLAASSRLQESRSDLARQSDAVFEHAVAMAIKEHHPEEAFNLSERARTTKFLYALGSADLAARAHLAPEFTRQESELRRRYVLLERQLGQELAKRDQDVNSDRVVRLRAQMEDLRKQYRVLTDNLKTSASNDASWLVLYPLNLSEVQRSLDQDTTLVSYYATSTEILAFVVTRSGFQTVELHPKDPKFSDALKVVPGQYPQANAKSALSTIYKTLIVPIRTDLKTKSLLIVLGNSLYSVPFAALTPDGTHFLSDDFIITCLPSASSLTFARKAAQAPPQPMLVLAAAQPNGSAPAEASGGEAEAVAALYSTTPRQSGASIWKLLQEQGPSSAVVHIVTRTDTLQKTSAGTALNGSGNLTFKAAPVAGLDLSRTSLVALSGKQADDSPVDNAGNLATLNEAFLFSGAQAVLVGLWDIDNDATKVLMLSFYGHLREGMPVASALRAAQRETRAKYPKPYYWASFALTGTPSN